MLFRHLSATRADLWDESWDVVFRDHFHTLNYPVEPLVSNGLPAQVATLALFAAIPLCAPSQRLLLAASFAAAQGFLAARWFELSMTVPVAAVDAAVSEAMRRSRTTRVRLFGYSGGGAIAALVAARRSDVAELVTVAGTLDHDRWTRDDGVTPLYRSLNPADEAVKLQSLPQVHFVGADDDVVPSAVVESYLARMTDRSRARLVRLPDYGHECCWKKNWRSLLDRYVYAGTR